MSDHRFRVQIHFDGEKSIFVARAPELPECQAEGATAEEALASLGAEVEAQIENIRESGGRVPVPVDEEDLSGEVTLKISKSLHRELKFLAALEELEVSQLGAELLQQAIQRRLQDRPRHRRHPGPPRAEVEVNGNTATDEQQPRDRAPERDDRQGFRDRGPRRGGGPANYHQIMEDKASFLEYVRNLEQGGGAHPRGGRRRR
ncbi:MAG: type II toxin-antitoxin system HicB family antitoxin [Polyangia bacterium]|jgi:predicted RNase H-like HicB family nuclease|nr:type II toxin-antitoxin system HicB family antitoxin [Polyangia bacterium]